MVSAKEAILTVLNIDYDNQIDNWGAYDRTTVKVADRDKYSGTQQANYDNVLVQGTKWNTGYPTLNLGCVDGDSVVRIDIRSTNPDRIQTLKDKIISIINTNRTTLSSPWHYMLILDRGINLSRGKKFRFIVELRLYIVDEILS